MQDGTSPPKWTKRATQKVYVGHLHHYSKFVPLFWDPKTKLVSPQCHVMFDDNFDMAKPPDRNITIPNTMNRLFKTNNYKYDDPFGNENTYIFSYGGVDIHPDNISPDIKTCQESITTASTSDETDSITSYTSSNENSTNNRYILSMNDLRILHDNNIFPKTANTTLKRIHNYIALTCKYAQSQNHQNKKPTIWDYLTSMKMHLNSSSWTTMSHMTNLITT
jgi:hypothetical protein